MSTDRKSRGPLLSLNAAEVRPGWLNAPEPIRVIRVTRGPSKDNQWLYFPQLYFAAAATDGPMLLITPASRS